VSTATPTSVSVTPTSPTTHLGINLPFAAVVLLSDNTSQTVTGNSTWTSSDNSVATVGTTSGLATPVVAGSTTITATYQGLKGTAQLTVNGSALSTITVSPNPLNVAVGGHQQLAALGTYADSSTEDLTNVATWLSSTGAATVSNAAGSHGYLTGVSTGSPTVTATFRGVNGTVTANIGSTSVVPDAGATD
jgi:hypothetical protein